MKKLFLPILLVAGMFPLIASATCYKTGHIERVTAYANSYGTYHYIYFRTSALSNVVWYTYTADDMMAEIASNALSNATHVGIQGNAASCPPSGGSIGQLNYLIVNP